MKIYRGSYYEVKYPSGTCALSGNFETEEEAKVRRDAQVVHDAEMGYTPVNYIITRTDWTKVFTDDDVFYSTNYQTVSVEG